MDIKSALQILNSVFKEGNDTMRIQLVYDPDAPTPAEGYVASITQLLNKIYDGDEFSLSFGTKYDFATIDEAVKNIEVVEVSVTANVEVVEAHTKGRPVLHWFVSSTGETMPVTLYDVTDTGFKLKIVVSGTLYYM